MAGGAKYLKHIGEPGLKRRGDDVGAGNHDVADLHFVQGKDIFQQRALLRRNIVLDRSIRERILDVVASRQSAEAEQSAQPVEQAWLRRRNLFCRPRSPAGFMFSHWRRLLPRSTIPGRGRQSRACARIARSSASIAVGFGRPGMVVADKMQKAMHQEMGDVIAQRLACFGGFPRGGLERDDDVA